MNIREQVTKLCESLENKKAQDIVAIHVGDKTIIADWFIICSGRSQTQLKTLADEVTQQAEAFGLSLRRKDGYQAAQWIVLDFADILVHIFLPDERKYYNMERLWMDQPENAIYFSPGTATPDQE